MKNPRLLLQFIFTFCFFVFLGNKINAQNKAISPEEDETYYTHLFEVNKQWICFQERINFQKTTISFDNDIDRIQFHLQMVETHLRKDIPSHFSKKQIANRIKNLNVLKEYWITKEFPINHYHQIRQPYFVDNNGTACAVGFLLLEDGQLDIVDKIKTVDNYAYIHELTKYKELGVWADQNGFTMDELAWIQPGYPPSSPTMTALGMNEGVEGQVNVMITNDNDNVLFIAGEFTSVDGVLANNIISWNGQDWYTFGEGVDGRINDMLYSDDRLYIVGYFYLPEIDELVNVAYREMGQWHALQIGEMEGEIFAIEKKGSNIYIGGNFQKVGNEPFSNLAKYNTYEEEWNSIGHIDGEEIDNAFSVNEMVTSFDFNGNHLLVGGHFTKTAPDLNEGNEMQLDTKYLAYWTGSKWVSSFDGDYPKVESMLLTDNALYIGGIKNEEEENIIAVFNNGLWQYANNQAYVTEFNEFSGDGKVHQFIESYNNVFSLVGLYHYPVVGTYGSGILQYAYGEPLTNSNGTVRAATIFQNQIYFAGDFTEISYENLNNFAVLGNFTPTYHIEDENMTQVYYSNQEIRVKNLSTKNTTFSLFNIQGQLIEEFNNINTNLEVFISTTKYPTGTYIYNSFDGEKIQSGKLVVY